MDYPPKTVTCKCGNKATADRKRIWCQKCGNPVYYHPEEQKWHRINSIYAYAAFIAFLFLVAYFFIEMIGNPFFN